jgi:2',3'-cyclic-nucleotide 2'-phosphodiesterase (5'-nucleotidase family)
LQQPAVVRGVPIVHAGPYGQYVSRTNLQYDGSRWRLRDFKLLPLLA